MIALLAPAVTVTTFAMTGPLLGWRVAAWHTAFVAGMVAALIELAVLALDRVPFTRPYAAGDAKLRRRWPVYFLGMYVFAFFPVRIELHLLGGQEPWLVAAAMGAAITCHLIGRARARRWSVEPPEELLQDGGTISVLNIGHVSPPVPAVNRGAI